MPASTPNYVIDPTRFYAEGAVVDWLSLARRLGLQEVDVHRLQPTLELRWMLRGDLGMPTEPFQVWARPHVNQAIETKLAFSQMQLFFLGGYTAITWPNGSMSHVSVDLTSSGSGAMACFAGGPLLENVGAVVNLISGSATVELSAPVIDGLLVSPGINVTAVRGIPTDALLNAAGWTLIELVGIPVKLADWNGIGRHGTPQGMISALTDAPNAGIERLKRGAPRVGWGTLLAPGTPAPLWSEPDYGRLVDEVNAGMLDSLRSIVGGFVPNQQVSQQLTVSLPPPRNSSGQQMTAPGSTSHVSPLAITLMAAGSDPYLSLVLGFGTAYPFESGRRRGGRRSTPGLPGHRPLGKRSRWQLGAC